MKDLGVDVDAQVARMGEPVPPMFWFRDPTGHTLMVVESEITGDRSAHEGRRGL
jgi:hypothetical protein